MRVEDTAADGKGSDREKVEVGTDWGRKVKKRNG
jgi:hypothetical protein